MKDMTRRGLLAKLGVGAAVALTTVVPVTANALTCGEDLRNGQPRKAMQVPVIGVVPGTVVALNMVPTLDGLKVRESAVLPYIPENLGLSPDRSYLDVAVAIRPDRTGVDVFGLDTLFAYAAAESGRCIINIDKLSVSKL